MSKKVFLYFHSSPRGKMKPNNKAEYICLRNDENPSEQKFQIFLTLIADASKELPNMTTNKHFRFVI